MPPTATGVPASTPPPAAKSNPVTPPSAPNPLGPPVSSNPLGQAIDYAQRHGGGPGSYETPKPNLPTGGTSTTLQPTIDLAAQQAQQAAEAARQAEAVRLANARQQLDQQQDTIQAATAFKPNPYLEGTPSYNFYEARKKAGITPRTTAARDVELTRVYDEAIKKENAKASGLTSGGQSNPKQQILDKLFAQQTQAQSIPKQISQQAVVTLPPLSPNILDRTLQRIDSLNKNVILDRQFGSIDATKEAQAFLANAAIPVLNLAKLGETILTKPQSAPGLVYQGFKNIPSAALEFGTQARYNPVGATGRIFGEILTAEALTRFAPKVEDIVSAQASKLSTAYRAADIDIIPNVPLKQTFTASRPGLDLKQIAGEDVSNFIFQKQGTTDIELIRPGNVPSLTLKTQASFAGETPIAITSAQRDFFTIKNDLSLINKAIKEGDIPTLNQLMGREVLINKPLPTPESPLLERSFFASPPNTRTGLPTLRVSRLGLQPTTSSILDLFNQDIKLALTRPKPQVILFENAKIAQIPSQLRSLLIKAQSGDVDALAQFGSRYLDFQLTPTGEFKPLGFVTTREAEPIHQSLLSWIAIEPIT